MGWLITRRRFVQITGLGALGQLLGRVPLLGQLPSIVFSTPGGPAEKKIPYEIFLMSNGRIPSQYAGEWPEFDSSPLANDLPEVKSVRILRASDLLDLILTLDKVEMQRVTPPYHSSQLRPIKVYFHRNATLRVTFPPQHFLEWAKYDPLGNLNWPNPQSFTVQYANSSHLIFQLRDSNPDERNTPPLFFTLDNFLSWDRWPMIVTATALPPYKEWPNPSPSVVPSAWKHLYPPSLAPLHAKPPPPAVDYTEYETSTSIEFPWRTLISPHAGEKWATPQQREALPGATELWHARLTDPNGSPTVRVTGYLKNDPLPTPPITSGQQAIIDVQNDSLPSEDHRKALCLQTADFDYACNPTFDSTVSKERAISPPHAVNVKELMLSSQGAYSKMDVEWNTHELPDYDPKSIAGWSQITTWGRDQDVTIKIPGFGMPFGHDISYIVEHKRLFKDYQGDRFAALCELFYCIVNTPVISYDLTDSTKATLPVLQRGYCFKSVELWPRQTPLLMSCPDLLNGPRHGHWMVLLDEPDKVFKFKVLAVDWQDNEHHFEMPLYWVPLENIDYNATPQTYTAEVDYYNSIDTGTPKQVPGTNDPNPKTATRTAPLSKQRVAFIQKGASNGSANSRDSALETTSLKFRVAPGKGQDPHPDVAANPNWPAEWIIDFYPQLDSAVVRLDAASAMDSGKGQFGATFAYHKAYLQYGFGTNDGQLRNTNEFFGAITPPPPDLATSSPSPAQLKFDSGKSGGTATPNFTIIGVSRKFGPWGGQPPPPSPAPVVGFRPGAVSAAGPPPTDYSDPDGDFTQIFRAADFLSSDAFLLGAQELGLGDIIADVQDTLQSVERVPKMISQVLATLNQDVGELKDFLKNLRDSVVGLEGDTLEYCTALGGWLDYWAQTYASKFIADIRNALLDEVAIDPGFANALVGHVQTALGAFNAAPAVFDRVVDQVAMAVLALKVNPDEITDQVTSQLTAQFNALLSNELAVLQPTQAQIDDAIAKLITAIQNNSFVSAIVKARSYLPIASLPDDDPKSLAVVVTGLRKALSDSMRKNGVLDDVNKYCCDLLLSDKGVLATIQASWQDPMLLLNCLGQDLNSTTAKIDTLCTQLTQDQIKQLKKDVGQYESGLQTLLEAYNKSLDRLRSYIITQFRNHCPTAMPSLDARVTDLLNLLDPDYLAKQITGDLRIATSLVDSMRDFPFAALEKVRALLDDLIGTLENPEKLLSEATRVLQNIADAIGLLANLIPGGGHLNGALGSPLLGAPVGGAPDPLQAALNALAKQFNNQIDQSAQEIQDKVKGLLNVPANPLISNFFRDVESQMAASDIATLEQWRQNFFTLRDGTHQSLDQAIAGVLGAGSAFNAVLDSLGNNLKAAIIARLNETQPPFDKCLELMKQVTGKVQSYLDGLTVLEQKAEEIFDQIPKQIAIDMDWSPQVKGNSFLEPSLDGQSSTFTLSAHIRKSLQPDQITQRPDVNITGQMTNFTLHLIPQFPALKVGFDSVLFQSINGQSPQTTVKIAKVEFDQALQYMAQLAATLNPQNGPYIQMIDGGVEGGFRYAVPNITSGGFNLFNLSIIAALQLWFDGRPMTVKFSISERDRPFLLSSGIYGGGGFLGITLTPNGIQTIEGSLEFGADILLDIGVATGQASVNAGIYFSISASVTQLSGFVHACGELDIIDLITLMVDFYLGLGYEEREGASYAVGECVVKVEIEMFMFSIEVDLHYRKEMQGSATPSRAGGGNASLNTSESDFDFVDIYSGDDGLLAL